MSMSWATSRAVSLMGRSVGGRFAGRGGRSRVCTQYSYRSATTRSSASSTGRPPAWLIRRTTRSGESAGICRRAASSGPACRAEMKSVAASIARPYSDSRNEYSETMPPMRRAMSGTISGSSQLVMSAIGLPLARVTRSIFTSRAPCPTPRLSAVRRGAGTVSTRMSACVTAKPCSRSVSENEVTNPSFCVALKSRICVPRPCRM